MMSVGTVPVKGRASRIFKRTFKATRKIAVLGLAIYFIPAITAFFLSCGALDVLRNRRRTFSTLDRYFAGNGLFTLLLSPFNLFMDLLSLPYWNKGIYQIGDLPRPHQDEINTVIEAALKQDLVGKLEAKMEGQKRGMIFFKWYGKNINNSLDIPEFHQQFQVHPHHRRLHFQQKTIDRQALRPAPRDLARALQHQRHEGQERLHQSRQSHQLLAGQQALHLRRHAAAPVVQQFRRRRYCMFLDILRPSLLPRVTSAILSGIRLLMAPFNSIFYQHWTFLK